MKKRLNIRCALGTCIAAAILFSSPLFAQPTIPDITGVTEIHLDLACKATLIQGSKASLSITGDEDEIKNVEVKLKGDVLVIRNEENHQHKSDVQITITIPDLKKLCLGGVVDLTTPNQVKFDDLEFNIGGVVDLDIKLISKSVRFEAGGVLSGDISGETKDFRLEISGVGKINASEFKAENCDVEVSGVAKATVYATEKLDASVSGMGHIDYVGRPIVNKSSSGFGSISHQ